MPVIGVPQTDFGWALMCLRGGDRVARRGWNAQGQFVALQWGYPAGVPANEPTAKAIGVPVGTMIVFDQYFVLRNADGHYVPWTPSTGDCLAMDWYTVDTEPVEGEL
jgi:hypothetical protein